MLINWPLVFVLFGLSLPGVFIAIPRLINLLLKQNTDALKRKISRFAIAQTLVMTLLMSFAGTVLSLRTGLNEPVIEGLLLGKSVFAIVQAFLLPVFLLTLVGLGVFFVLYYGVVASLLDASSLAIMQRMRVALKLDGCILYGGVVEEIIARWGLMNVLVYFGILFVGKNTTAVMWTSLLVSGLLLSLGHLPAYLAAGCKSSRRFVYAMLLLSCWQTLLFGWLFWQYGLTAAIISHILFHIGWHLYDKA